MVQAFLSLSLSPYLVISTIESTHLSGKIPRNEFDWFPSGTEFAEHLLLPPTLPIFDFDADCAVCLLGRILLEPTEQRGLAALALPDEEELHGAIRDGPGSANTAEQRSISHKDT